MLQVPSNEAALVGAMWAVLCGGQYIPVENGRFQHVVVASFVGYVEDTGKDDLEGILDVSSAVPEMLDGVSSGLDQTLVSDPVSDLG
jgi:hypothetical protein